jgi:hypothetical protein
MTESDWSEEIPYSMEVGLLGTVRKVITLMPDNKVRRIVGYVVQHEALIALAHNKSIVFRTAVVRVSTYMYMYVHTCTYEPVRTKLQCIFSTTLLDMYNVMMYLDR